MKDRYLENRYISVMKYLLIKQTVYGLLFMFILKTDAQVSPLNYNNYSDEELIQIIDNPGINLLVKKQVSDIYLLRGKAEADTIKIARAYDRLSRLFTNDSTLIYADSVILYTKNLKHKTYPGVGYLLKATHYSNKRQYSKALANYSEAQRYAVNRENIIHEIFIRKCVIDITSRWSSPEKAIKLGNDLLRIIDTLNYETVLTNTSRPSFKINDSVLSRHYLIDKLDVINSLITSYVLNKQYEVALSLTDEANIVIQELGDLKKEIKLKRRIAEIEYYRGNYKSSIDTLSKYFSHLTVTNSKLNSYYYLGMNSIKLGNQKMGLDYLLKADSVYMIEPYIVPSQRPFLAELYKIYKSEGNKLLQVEILNKILSVDSLFKESYKNINKSLIDNFETPQLLAEKEKLIAQLEWEQGREKRKQLFTGFLLLLSLGGCAYYFWKQRQYKMRFAAIVKDGLQPQEDQLNKQKRNEISAEIVDDILKKLERFEAKGQFTRGDVSLQSVAKRFNTNSSYLSKVVNLKKDKNFSQYISELRISYAVDQLQNNPRFRKYTIKAIAEEVGFGNAQSFSKAFKARTGLHPSYFIRNLNKQYPNNATSDSILQTE
ncbi:helix-turn-helix domain-containing protein [Gilvibacter sediminis]|uniref:helix-turn-helix domain-containing protein n=1 Tax=Gilvibacter sediminis TaxID=379071 RepID=UPI0023503CFA|nr:helix-turn-helix domain-containing protein [Gilvibacter sediminis]MDC7998266.1 helix-turn-helix domain-containing protein [Gilvibacter sediminis]